MVKHQREGVVLKTTSNTNGHFKSGAAPLYRSLVTSLTVYMLVLLYMYIHVCMHYLDNIIVDIKTQISA